MHRRRKALAAAAAVIASLALVSSAAAATVTVNSISDNLTNGDNLCTLREAIVITNGDAPNSSGCTLNGAPGADTINFPGLDGATLQLGAVTDGELLVTDPDGLTISGPGSGANHLVIQAASNHRVIESTGGVPLTLNDLTVENGSVSDSTPGGAFASGGGIKAGGDLTLNRVLVSNNTATATASGSGNAFAAGGGVDATNGTLTITDSQITDNSAIADNPLLAGNDGNATSEGGGVLLGTATVSNTTISGNTASATDEHGTNPGDSAHTDGGGIAGPQLSLDHSTVRGNHATGAAPEPGAGDLVVGGGVFINGTSSIQLSTIAANQTSADANGADVGGGIGNFGTLTIDSATIAANGPVAGDSTSANLWPNTPIAIKNTIVAAPRGAGSTNCGPPVTTNGFNIDSDGSCGLVNGVNHDQTLVNAALGSLQDNGGPTATMLPGTSSPAIDAGSASGQTDSTRDQRGLTRPVDSSSHPNAGDGSDVGSVEAQAPAAATVSSVTPPSSNSSTSPNVMGGVSDLGDPEGASTVGLFRDPSCTTGAGSGTASSFGTTGIQGTATPNAVTNFYAHAQNAYGINSPCSSTFASFRNDSLGPVMTIDSGPTDPSVHTAAFAWHSTDLSPPVTYQCSLDTGTPNFSACASPFTSSSLPDGTYTFRVKGTDGLTNAGPAATRSFTVSTPVPSSTPPTTSPLTTPSPAPKKCKKAKKGSASAAKKCKKKKK